PGLLSAVRQRTRVHAQSALESVPAVRAAAHDDDDAESAADRNTRSVSELRGGARGRQSLSRVWDRRPQKAPVTRHREGPRLTESPRPRGTTIFARPKADETTEEFAERL